MSKLNVKTRRDVNPMGKPCVYFSCHPQDLELYFQLLSEDILKLQDCAVYYESEPEVSADPEALKLQLAEMQMFVVPVTVSFLTKPSRARDLEFAFAAEQHIPILPIAVEPGLDALFVSTMNRIGNGLGDLQYLDRTLKDSTAISYEEKLKSRLSSILVGNELASRVRAAFDAYIFLSYRKKDRAHAKELMRLIHRIPYCRDIAIWYDEFLTPGEAWNEAIAEAIQKSALVVLAVTPNLTEPGNFIIQHEYPDAKAKGKDVIPAELVPTDAQSLRRLFPGLARVVNGRDETSLSLALRKDLTNLAVKENDSSAEHNYLIGLAFLGGIDVERDPKRAEELIKSAAKDGLTEAIRQLACMYHDGNGVSRSYDEEIIWLQKLVSVSRKKYEKEKSEETAFELLSAYRGLGGAYYEMGKIGASGTVYEEMSRYAKGFSETYQNNAFQGILADNYDQLGHVAKAQGKDAGAAVWYRKSLELRNKRASQAGVSKEELLSMKLRDIAGVSDEIRRSKADLCKSYDNQGDMARAAGKLDTAYEWYHKGTEIREKEVKVYIKDPKHPVYRVGDSGTTESWRELGSSYNKLGDLCLQMKKKEEAGECYRKCLAIWEDLTAETGDSYDKENLAFAYGNMAELELAQERVEEALAWQRKCVELKEEVYRETESMASSWNVGTGYFDLGKIEAARNNPAQAYAWYKRAGTIFEELSDTTERLDAKSNAKKLYKNLAGMAERLGKTEEAAGWYQKKLSVDKAVFEETRTLDDCENISETCFRLSKLADAQGNYEQALTWLDQALEVAVILAKNGSNPRYKKNVEALQGQKKRISKKLHPVFEPAMFDVTVYYSRRRKRIKIAALTSRDVAYITVDGDPEREPVDIGKQRGFVYAMIRVQPGTTFEVIAYDRNGLASAPVTVRAE